MAITPMQVDKDQSEPPSLVCQLFPRKYLTGEVLNSWDDSGSQKIEKLVTQSVEENQLQLLVDILHELLIEITVVESSVPFDKLVATLQWIIDQHEIIPRLLLYTFSIIPENSRLNKALLSVKIDKSLLLLILDPARLISLNLHTSLFEKKIVRANTNFLYKQKRFNLLREESEGYTKLVVELQGASCGVGPHNKMEAQVLSAVNAIQSLIGYFDLDPVRSLDIIFDIFAMNIVRNSEFYLNVLKQSTWWPIHLATHGSLQDLSQGGNSMAAQIIGFKLKSYSQLGENVPDAYMMLVAVLIKEGFICLGDIYPFLSPSDDELLKHEDVWKKEMEEKTYMARASALALAAPLVDDDDTRRPISAGNSSSEKKHSQNDTVNKKNKQQQSKKSQKAQLLSFLLSVGSLYPSLFILSKFPFLPGAYPEIADMVNRLVEYTIEPLFLKTIINTKPTPSASLRPKKIPVSAIRDTELDDPRRKGEILVLHPPVSPVYDENRYRFFYSDWSVGLATVDSIEGLQSVSEILLKYSGPLISRNARLLVRICRIAKYFLQAKDNEEFWYEYFRNYILGAISVVGPNPGIIHEIFLVMQYFPFEARYALYGEWSAVLAKSNPHLKFATSKAEKDTKDVLKRLSKTNVREMMRRLAKISYANPIPSFTVFISQVESYDNLGDLVVEAARYFTDMGWDILPFVIMLQLTSGRGTIQSSGMSDRKWIQSLSSFSAKLCKRYSLMDSSPIVLYLLKEFHSQIGSGIILLRDLIAQMAGITQLSNLAKTQIEALGGCPSLRTLVFESIGDKRSISSRSGKRLADVLTNLNIASELFIILCQTHKGFIYTASDETAYQKVLAHRYDELTHVLIQYTELLNEFMDQETFENNMISISELCTKYGISPTYAFELWRNVIANKIRKFSRSDQDTEPFHPLLRSLIKSIKLIFPEEEWTYMSPGFYVTFWQLPLYDIQYPEPLYYQEEARLKEKLNVIDRTIRLLEADRSSTLGSIQEKMAEREKINSQISQLSVESKKHALHYKMSMTRLEGEQFLWFYPPESKELGTTVRISQIKQMLAHCILPRAVHSPMDALFCAKYIFTIHSLGTSNFSTLQFFDRLFTDGIMYATLLTCTSYEAENLGLFFSELFSELSLWRSDINIYEKRGLGKTFIGNEDGKDIYKYVPGMQIQFHEIISVKHLLDYEQFRIALAKWHRHTCSSIVDCLKSKDYMQRRNTITLLRNMNESFPIISDQGYTISDALDALIEEEDREDLKLSARALSGHLTRRAPNWIMLFDFKKVTPVVKQNILDAAKKRLEDKNKRDSIKPGNNAVTKSTRSATPTSRASTPSTSTLKGSTDGALPSGSSATVHGPVRPGTPTGPKHDPRDSSRVPSQYQSRDTLKRGTATLPAIPRDDIRDFRGSRKTIDNDARYEGNNVPSNGDEPRRRRGGDIRREVRDRRDESTNSKQNTPDFRSRVSGSSSGGRDIARRDNNPRLRDEVSSSKIDREKRDDNRRKDSGGPVRPERGREKIERDRMDRDIREKERFDRESRRQQPLPPPSQPSSSSSSSSSSRLHDVPSGSRSRSDRNRVDRDSRDRDRERDRERERERERDREKISHDRMWERDQKGRESRDGRDRRPMGTGANAISAGGTPTRPSSRSDRERESSGPLPPPPPPPPPPPSAPPTEPRSHGGSSRSRRDRRGDVGRKRDRDLEPQLNDKRRRTGR